MSLTYIGRMEDAPRFAFITESEQTPTGDRITIRTAVVKVEDLQLMVEHFTDDDVGRTVLDADTAEHLADLLRGHAHRDEDDE